MSMMMSMEKKHSRSVAEIMMADYEDILTEILLRVPARTVIRFKCVSRRWLSLISEPSFSHRHTLRNPRPAISAFLAYTQSYVLDHVDYIPLHPIVRRSSSNHPLCYIRVDADIEFVQSCNGLLLSRLRDTVPASLTCYVHNLTTSQVYSLTHPPVTSPCQVFAYGLAFDPSVSPHYKVVVLWSDCRHIEIYSSQTRTWKLLDSSFEVHFPVNYDISSIVYWNGALHWVGLNLELLYYHIDEERPGLAHGLPCNHGQYRHYDYNNVFRCFRESRDCLHLIDIIRRGSRTKFRVWEMGKDYSGWSLKYNVDLAPLFAAYPCFQPTLFVVLSLITRGEDDDLLQLHGPDEVIVYDLRNNTFKSTHLTPTPAFMSGDLFPLYKKGYHYVESLALV